MKEAHTDLPQKNLLKNTALLGLTNSLLFQKAYKGVKFRHFQ